MESDARLELHMHKSRLAGFIIDCQTDDLKSAATFWGGALGMDVHALPPAKATSTFSSSMRTIVCT